MEEKPRLMQRRLVLAVNFKLHITKDPQNIPSWGERDAMAYVNTTRFQSRLICGFAIGKVLWSALLYHAKGERGGGGLVGRFQIPRRLLLADTCDCYCRHLIVAHYMQ